MITIAAADYLMTWGSQKSARRVSGLSKEIRDAVRAGEKVIMTGCPEVRGINYRVVVESCGRFYTRMPK